MFQQNSEDSNLREFVPGTTAGPTSPGTLGPSYGFPAPISYGSNTPQTQQYGGGVSGTQLSSLQNSQQLLSQFIGKKVKAIFVFAGQILRDFSGTLQGIGSDYILIQETDADDLLVGDLASLKILQIYK